MGNSKSTEYRYDQSWHTGTHESPIYTVYGDAISPITLAYGFTNQNEPGPKPPSGNWKLIGAAQKLSNKDTLYYLYGKVEVPNRIFHYVIVKNNNSNPIPLHQNYKLIGNEIVHPNGYPPYLENQFRTIVKSRNWNSQK